MLFSLFFKKNIEEAVCISLKNKKEKYKFMCVLSENYIIMKHLILGD